MIDVTVIRDGGGVLGEDIIDNLITANGVAVQRGRTEIEKNAKVRMETLEARYVSGIRTGQVVLVLDALQGEQWRGKVAGVTINGEGIAPLLSLRIERPI